MTGRLFADCRGTAAVEMALIAPMLLILMMGAVELGNYFLSEHVLVKAVRDGAIYAARRDIYDCTTATPPVSAAAKDDTKKLVRTGELGSGSDRLPNWSSATFDVTVACATSAGGTTMKGMFTQTGGKVAIVTVSARLPYRSLLGTIGFNATDLYLHASEESTAIGV